VDAIVVTTNTKVFTCGDVAVSAEMVKKRVSVKGRITQVFL
jgi:hypothetical protein